MYNRWSEFRTGCIRRQWVSIELQNNTNDTTSSEPGSLQLETMETNIEIALISSNIKNNNEQAATEIMDVEDNT